MPNVTIPLPNVEESVSRPLVADLTAQVKEMTGLKYIDDVRFINYSGNIRLPDSATTDEKDRYATFSGQTRIFVEAEENTHAEGWATTVVERIEHVPLFADPSLGVWVTPVVIPTDLVLKVRYQTRSRDDARRWRDGIMIRMAQLSDGMQHTLTFGLDLPANVWHLLYHIWEKREAVGGYKQDFVTYVKQHSDKDLTILSNAAGGLQSFSFRRLLARVNGYFDVSPLPEKPSFDESGAVWECVLNYKITYDRPSGCVVRYPIQIHQQFLDDKYIIPENTQPNANDRDKKLTQSQQAFSMFESYQVSGYYCSQDAFIQIPPFDDFVYRILPKGTATVVLGLLQLEKPGPQVTLNLADLGDEQIDQEILDFIREVEYPYLNQPYKSFFSVNLFREQDLVRNDILSVDKDLNVHCAEDMNLRSTYRVRFALTVDPSLLPLSAFERLYKYPNVIIKLVGAINEALRYNVDFQELLRLRPLHAWEFTKLWHILNGLKPLPETGLGTSTPGNKDDGFNWQVIKDRPKGNGGYVWDGGKWTGGKTDPSRTSDTMKPKDPEFSGEMFGIPQWAYLQLMKTPKMRTVQISGTIVQRK